ncbi:hypothetical protein MOA67_gp296 [Klebsiella phage KpLz-2_45]|uniref:hypothetical protein n=1 Tax=Klebsiella phage KpLz-2_45 TaxID=2698923 RepID=UPI001F12F90F|nr:hypothetical protein MOA67_gp296 [Klebsiella phage KpLz-2_45]UKS72127.1 hypothetical protein KpLz245_2610 [Klebsiella phage KpLz-2_45]
MITFELTGCAGLQERREDGMVATIHHGNLLLAKDGKLIAELSAENYREVKGQVTKMEIYKLYSDLQNKVMCRTYRIVSRHPVAYDDRKFEYEYRWLEDKKEDVGYLTLEFNTGTVAEGLRKKRITSPTNRDDLNDKILRLVLENALIAGQ